MKVNILVTADRPEDLPLTTLFKDTIRVGFPTADITVWDNASQCRVAVEEAARHTGAKYSQLFVRQLHGDWIHNMIAQCHDEETMVIVDPDTIWWGNVEGFKFNHPLAGFFQPYAYYEWTRCNSMARIHTHFMWFQNPLHLLELLHNICHFNHEAPFGYRDTNLFLPHFSYVLGRPLFYDTCAELYQAIGSEMFTIPHLECYDHINSASFRPWVQFENQDGFERVHRLAVEDPKQLKGFWREMVTYWKRMAKLAEEADEEWMALHEGAR